MCREVACHQHFAEQGKQWLDARMRRLRHQMGGAGEGSEPTPSLLLDVFDVDQYGRLVVDVRGVAVGPTEHLLPRWTFAIDCVKAGWAHTTPLHIEPPAVREALLQAQTNMSGAWGLQTDETVRR